MKLSEKLRAVGRGAKLAYQIVKAGLREPSAAPAADGADEGSRLVAFKGFGDNPGRLRMLAHIPPSAAGRPLVVLLHGCEQSVAEFAEDSGWIELADRLHFPLVLPEQARTNNAGRCFHWFRPEDTARNSGEAGSIANMTRAAISRFDSDPERVFIVGLSAGAAMAAAMLAAYPDLFAAGASVAGLPVGVAKSSMQAMLRMASPGPHQRPENWAAQVRAAAPSGFAGPWPRLSIWQGQADSTVAPENGKLLATQWREVHGLTEPGITEQVGDGVLRQVWPDARQPVVELWSLSRLPHAYPAGTRDVAPGRFVAPAPIDATAGIAGFFGLD